MRSSSEEVGITSPSAKDLVIMEVLESIVHDGATASSVSLNTPMKNDFNGAEREGEECVRQVL